MDYAFGWCSDIGYGALCQVRNLGIVLLLTSSAVDAEPVRIAALGDSLTAGYGLPPQEGFVPQMEAWLEGQGVEVELINAGVSGDTTAGGLSRVGWTLSPDVDGMIVALGGNDYLRGLDPEVSLANLDGILAAADRQDVDILLVGLAAGSNYGPEYKEEFDGIYPALANRYDVPLYGSWFSGLLAEAGVQERVPEFMQSDGIHPNAEGVRAIVAAMGPAVLDLVERATD